MLIKSFFKIVLGMALFACVSSQSYAVDTPRASVMRAVAKVALDGATHLSRGALYIVRNNPVVAADRFAGGVKTIAGTVISQGVASIEAWGFLVDSYKDEGEKSYYIGAIEKAQYLNSPSVEDITADDGQSPGLFLAAWFYGAVKPVIYFLYAQLHYDNTPGLSLIFGGPDMTDAFNAVSHHPAHYPYLIDEVHYLVDAP